MRRFTDRTSRVALSMGVLAVVVLVAAIAWQAVTAERSQRATAEAVLRDYAEFAANQYARGMAIALDYDWFLPVAQRPRWYDDELMVPEPGAPVPTQSAGRFPLGVLVSTFFAVGHEGEIFAAAEWPDPAPLLGRAQLERTVAELRESSRSAHVRLIGADNAEVFLVVWLNRDDPGPTDPVAFGFVADPATAQRVLGRALAEYTVLPPSFGESGGTEFLSVRLSTPGGRVLFETGPPFDPTFVSAAELGPERAGLVASVAVSPARADQLVRGGLPGSRLPVVFVMFVVAAGLLAAGSVVLRRERELMALRERFIAGASHELRTPMAQIRMFAETLRLDRVRSEPERERSLEILDREARRLSYLVDNLLHFSRPAAESTGQTGEVVLGDVAADVIDGFAPLARAKGVSVELVVDGHPTANVDRDAMQQVLLNMLDNATKYGPDGQTITVTVGSAPGGRVALSVDDEGPGVPAEERMRIWERFWRGGGAAGTTGTGIGLSLVKELAESNGGEVSVDDAPGGGARFLVVLPGGV